MKKNVSVLILAAGKSTRMKSKKSKVLLHIANKPMILHIIDTCKNAGIENISVVLNNDSREIQDILPPNIDIIIQKEQLGTAHAILTSEKKHKKNFKNLLILYGDVPLLSKKTILKILERTAKGKPHMLAFESTNPKGYGRLITNKNIISKVVEEKNANNNEKNIKLCNSGILCAKTDFLFTLLKRIKKNNKTKEFLLTDIFEISYKLNYPFNFLIAKEHEVLGVNNRKQLAFVENLYQNMLRDRFMKNGVTLVSPETTFFSYDTRISNDVKIGPNNYFGKGVIIKSDVIINNNCSVEETHIDNSTILGPFCRLRNGNRIGKNVKIGNFVEIKKSKIGNFSKINHLSYIGDSEIGSNSNIGAGTITCNYDGQNKNKTFIGNNVFIGSNCSIVAPIDIKSGSFVAAGSTITKNLEKFDFSIGRARQKIFKNGSKKYLK